ncbi:MAG: patatin-like phospholipase family protein [Hyphomonadaceae bacterium]
MALKLRSKSRDPGELSIPSLKTVPFVKDAPERALKQAQKDLKWFGLPGGWQLFDVGDPADMIYFVLSGSLGAFRKTASGALELEGHIRAGEPVGEMSLIAGTPHERAAYALRDTEVVGLSRAGFMQLVKADPRILERLTRVIMLRMRQARRKVGRTAEPRVFGLLSTSPTIDLKLRAEALAANLRASNLRVAIVGEEAANMPVGYFDELEAHNDIVMLLASIGDTLWYRLVQRYSDRLWLFARSDARPSVPLLPDDPSPARQFRLVDVVLLNLAGTRKAAETLEWKNAAGASRILHWRGMNEDDGHRLARTMSGRSVGVVFSGGGARAYAHIGVLRALREAECPIDFIGGSSMGAIIAACHACGWDMEEIDLRIRKAFVESNPLSDYRLPVVALVKGHKVDARLKEHFGDLQIEDLKVPFFAVSTNLTQGAYRVHSEGPLRKALRASISLPGILPPIVWDNQVLVDGAVLNNFPVDVMRNLHRGRIIGVDVAQAPEGLSADEFRDPPSFFGWTMHHGLSSPPPIANLLMRAATVSVDPNAHRGLTDMLIAPELSGIELRDWQSYDRAVEAGYNAAKEAIGELSGPLATLIRGSASAAEAESVLEPLDM